MLRSLAIILVLAVLGLLIPDVFIPIGPSIGLLLGLIMFTMGITLDLDDFRKVATNWKLVALGSGLQFMVMPLMALGVSTVLGLSTAATVGMVLVGCAPGGTASNVIVFIGKGNVPLSISLTLVSTILSPFLTPLLIKWSVGESVQFDLLQVVQSIAQMVLIPIALGMALKRFASKFTAKLIPFTSLVATITIGVIIAFVMAINKDRLLNDFPALIFLGVILHNLSGFALGFFGARLFGADYRNAKTIAIEVGMQNSGLAVTLAQKFFASLSGAGLPGAMFSLWHNVAGLTFVSLFRKEK